MATSSKYYYYANSEKIPLSEQEDLVAVDGAQVVAAGLSQIEWEKLRGKGSPLLKGWWLVDGSGLGDAALKALRRRKAIQHVFKAQGAYIIAFPEIQLEEGRASKKADLQDWLKQNEDHVVVLENNGSNWLIKAKSGDGLDALRLANALTEKLRPKLSQSRFVRVVKRPK